MSAVPKVLTEDGTSIGLTPNGELQAELLVKAGGMAPEKPVRFPTANLAGNMRNDVEPMKKSDAYEELSREVLGHVQHGGSVPTMCVCVCVCIRDCSYHNHTGKSSIHTYTHQFQYQCGRY